MSVDVVMPRLSDSMEEGTILKWLKAPGDEVALGDELVEIETDKANMVYEAPDAGSLIEVLANEGDTLPIGEVIARVGEAGEAPSGEAGGGSSEGSRDAAKEGDGDAGSPSSPLGRLLRRVLASMLRRLPPPHLPPPPPPPSPLPVPGVPAGRPPPRPPVEMEGSRRRRWLAGLPPRAGSSSGRFPGPGQVGGSSRRTLSERSPGVGRPSRPPPPRGQSRQSPRRERASARRPPRARSRLRS